MAISSEKLDRLKTVLDTYGADPARWPDKDRHDLAELLAEAPGMRDERREAADIDLVLSAASRPGVPAGARSRLLDVARTTTQTAVQDSTQGSARRLWPSNFAAASTLAASLLFGVYVGSLEGLDQFLPAEGDTSVWFDAGGIDDPLGLEGGDDGITEGNG